MKIDSHLIVYFKKTVSIMGKPEQMYQCHEVAFRDGIAVLIYDGMRPLEVNMYDIQSIESDLTVGD